MSEHVQCADLALGIVDPYLCFGGAIFAMACLVSGEPLVVALFPDDPDEDARPYGASIGECGRGFGSGHVCRLSCSPLLGPTPQKELIPANSCLVIDNGMKVLRHQVFWDWRTSQMLFQTVQE